MSVSVEVVDCTIGRPAEGMAVTLQRREAAGWQHHGSARTDQDGCVPTFEAAAARGNYRLTVEIDRYFLQLGIASFQTSVDVTFRIEGAGDPVHLLLMVTPSTTSVCRTGLAGRRSDPVTKW